MPYEVEVAPSAVAQILSLDPRLIDAADVALQLLADDPHGVSRPSAPPAEMPGYLVYDVPQTLDGRRHLLKFLFNFRNDGLTLEVLRVGHIEYGNPP